MQSRRAAVAGIRSLPQDAISFPSPCATPSPPCLANPPFYARVGSFSRLSSALRTDLSCPPGRRQQPRACAHLPVGGAVEHLLLAPEDGSHRRVPRVICLQPCDGPVDPHLSPKKSAQRLGVVRARKGVGGGRWRPKDRERRLSRWSGRKGKAAGPTTETQVRGGRVGDLVVDFAPLQHPGASVLAGEHDLWGRPPCLYQLQKTGRSAERTRGGKAGRGGSFTEAEGAGMGPEGKEDQRREGGGRLAGLARGREGGRDQTKGTRQGGGNRGQARGPTAKSLIRSGDM